MNKTHIKIVVTVVAALLFIVHQWIRFDTIGLGLLFIAVLPWLSSFLQSAELPGGWKFQFDQVKEEQEKQKYEIERLKFLIEGFVSEDELKHLRKIHSKEPFLVKVDGTTRYFESELRRLRALGLVANPPGKGIRSLLINDGKERDVTEHFYITAKGEDYLRLRNDTTAA